MSLVGNFTSNYDREAAAGGVPTPEMQARRPSQSHFHEEDNRNDTSSNSSTIAAQNSPPRSHHATGSVEKEVPYNKDAEDRETERRENEVLQLARRLTSQSAASAYHQNPFQAAPGSALDPSGENFNARAWTKAMMNLQLSDENAAPPRQAGIAFRNLNVHGFGADTDYQKSVGNVWLEGPALLKKLKGDKGRKINILQGCDGVVEAGEMLVVLGPPGSGCSTFLKTITGETHGFFVDEKSRLNYQGMWISISGVDNE
jgi:ATPase subunit of ABC transporter with duplicated ATPase domains